MSNLQKNNVVSRTGDTMDGPLTLSSIIATSNSLSIKPTTNATTAIQLQNAAGTSILNVDTTNGRVGIGTTGPGANLHIYGDGANSVILLGESGATDKTSILKYFQGNGSGTGRLWIGHWGDNDAVGVGLNIKKGGNVGIGTTGPTDKLSLANPGAGNQVGVYFADPTNSAYGGRLYFDDTSNTFRMVTIENNSEVSGGIVVNRTSGNVGIGTTSPTNLLSLGGNAARIFWMERGTVANTVGYQLTLQSGGATAGATDKAGGLLLLKPGVSTGSGESGITLQGCVAGAAGTADRSFQDMIEVMGNKLSFYNTAPIAQQTGVAVSAAGIHAALVSLGLITA